MRPSSVAVLAGVVLAAFTVWITRQAKALEQDLDASSRRIALLGQPAPDFHVTTLDGKNVSLADYRGKKLVLVFWASWNSGSRPAMLILSVLDRRFRQSNPDFDILAVAVDDEQADVRNFVSASSIPFPVALDRNRQLANSFQIRTVPTTLVIEPDGKVGYGATGFEQGRQADLARHLGFSATDLQMEMMGRPRGRSN